MKENILFTLRYKLHDGSRLKIQAIHTGKYDDRGCSRITIRAIHFGEYEYVPFGEGLKKKRKFRRVIWEKGDTWYSVGPTHSDDGKQSKKAATSLVSETHTYDDQLPLSRLHQTEFAKKYGDELSCMAEDRYGED